MFTRERPVQSHVDHAEPFVGQRVDRLHHGIRAGTHQYDDAFGLRIAVVIEQPVLAMGELRETIHRILHNARRRLVEPVDRFPPLEIDVRILRRAANERIVRIQRPVAMLVDQAVVHHRPHVGRADQFDLADLVRSPEPVKEMNERHARL